MKAQEKQKKGELARMNKLIQPKTTNGITLIALVVTIIVLIILATVSINAVFGENGLIKKAELAKQKMKLSEYEERIKIIVLNEYTGKMIDATKKDIKLIDLVKKKLEEEDWIANVEKVEGEENQLKITTKDVYILVIEVSEDGTVEIIEKGKYDGYTISYDANKGTGAPSSQTVISGKSTTISATTPTRTRYLFKGWSTSNTATEETYTAGQTITPTGDMTLYAVWQLVNTAPTEPTTSVTSRGTDNFVINAKSTDSDGDNLNYKLYVKTTSSSNYTLATTSESTTSGTEVNLTASSLNSYTIYDYYVTVTDTYVTTTGTTQTTGTACSGTDLTCTGPFTAISGICNNGTYCSDGSSTEKTCYNAIGTTVKCGQLVNNQVLNSVMTCDICDSQAEVLMKCNGCSSVIRCFCMNHYSSYSLNNYLEPHEKTVYTCSTHNYTGSSSSHTYTATTNCTHGYSYSHYYCSEHNVNCGSSTSHTYTTCQHNKTSQHSCCTHGETSMHYPN